MASATTLGKAFRATGQHVHVQAVHHRRHIVAGAGQHDTLGQAQPFDQGGQLGVLAGHAAPHQHATQARIAAIAHQRGHRAQQVGVVRADPSAPRSRSAARPPAHSSAAACAPRPARRARSATGHNRWRSPSCDHADSPSRHGARPRPARTRWRAAPGATGRRRRAAPSAPSGCCVPDARRNCVCPRRSRARRPDARPRRRSGQRDTSRSAPRRAACRQSGVARPGIRPG